MKKEQPVVRLPEKFLGPVCDVVARVDFQRVLIFVGSRHTVELLARIAPLLPVRNDCLARGFPTIAAIPAAMSVHQVDLLV